ncbi:hypothetical protein TNCV_802441 [Trichonephila clavipes]|nr:hypothetical protein TNCV_802441 [Trichonephila clavipes]
MRTPFVVNAVPSQKNLPGLHLFDMGIVLRFSRFDNNPPLEWLPQRQQTLRYPSEDQVYTLKLLKGWLVHYSPNSVASVLFEGFQRTSLCPPQGLGVIAVGLFILELHPARGRSRGFSRCQRLPERLSNIRLRNILRGFRTLCQLTTCDNRRARIGLGLRPYIIIKPYSHQGSQRRANQRLLLIQDEVSDWLDAQLLKLTAVV